MEDNFLTFNAVIAGLFVLIYALLLHALIGHMREMVRLKYHVDRRAEFDESRVKIVIGMIALMWLAYGLVWIFSLTSLDLANRDDYDTANALFRALNISLLIGAYVIFFINNRIKKDIAHIRSIANSAQDKSQNLTSHL
jgi:bacteriorhodopsin